MRVSGDRILLKISGEALLPRDGSGTTLDLDFLQQLAEQIARLHEEGCDFGIVVGGGNIWRGAKGKHVMSATDADHMGMLATIINGLAVKSALVRCGIDTRVMSAIPAHRVCEDWIPARAVRHLEKHRVVIAVAGVGEPNFTTDTGAAQRAIQINANVLLKGTHNVDGVYDDDPRLNADAQRYTDVTFEEVHQKRLEALDRTAFALCEANKMPLIVFNVMGDNAIRRALHDPEFGTFVHP